MNEVDLILKSFCELSVKPLFLLREDENVGYSFDLKVEFITKMDKLYKKLRSQGINKLKYIKVRCEYCYPDKPSYEFYSTNSKRFIMRYIIFKESRNLIRVEECLNRPSFNPFSTVNLKID